MNMKRVTIAFVVAMLTLSASAALPTKFRWDNVDGKCYTTPVKKQTGSTDRSYAYAMMDYLETMRLIQMGKSYDSLTADEKNKAIGPVVELAIDAAPRAGCGESFDLWGEIPDYPSALKTLDWILRTGFDNRRVTDFEFLTYQDGDDTTQDTAAWRVNIRHVKERIVETGPLVASYKSVESYVNGNYYYFPCLCKTQYNIAENYYTTLIIGYDDTIPASAFYSEGKIPAGNGAWIAKGSYGTDFGDNGYFYISYYDKNIFSTSDALAMNSLVSSGYDITIDSDRQYAEFYGHSVEHPSAYGDCRYNTSYANMFVAECDGVVNAIGIFGSNVSYHNDYGVQNDAAYIVSAYVGCDENNPVSGVKVLDCVELHMPPNSFGYHTLKLPKEFSISKGSRFLIVVDQGGQDGVAFLKLRYPGRGRSFVGRHPENDYSQKNATWWDIRDYPYTLAWGWGTGHNSCFITAYTKAAGASIELTASKGDYDGYVYVSWTKPTLGNGYYDLYRRTGENGKFELIAPCVQGLHFKDEYDSTQPDVKYWYYVRTRVDTGNTWEEIESNKDWGIHVTKPAIVNVRVAPLWLTGEHPYNVELTWNNFNAEWFEVTDVDFDLWGVKGPALKLNAHYVAKVGGADAGARPDNVEVFDVPIDVITKGNNGKHGQYTMDVKWNYKSLNGGSNSSVSQSKAKISAAGNQENVFAGVEVNVYFHKYHQDCQGVGGAALANWFYHWPNDEAISNEGFCWEKYNPNSPTGNPPGTPYDGKFHYSESGIMNGQKGLCEPMFDSYAADEDENIFINNNRGIRLLKVKQTKCRYLLTDNAAAIGDVFPSPTFTHYKKPKVGVAAEGIDKVAKTIQHETEHYTLYQRLFVIDKYVLQKKIVNNGIEEWQLFDWLEEIQRIKDNWGLDVGSENILNVYEDHIKRGNVCVVDTDGDGLSDEDEDASSSVFGTQFIFDKSKPDTYRLGDDMTKVENYKTHGDNEVLARAAEGGLVNGGIIVSVLPDNDWAFPGTKIAKGHQKYQSVNIESLGRQFGQDYRWWGNDTKGDKMPVKNLLQTIDGDMTYAKNWKEGKYDAPYVGRTVSVALLGRSRSETMDVFDGVIHVSGAGERTIVSTDYTPNVVRVVTVGPGFANHPDGNDRYAALGFQIALTNLTADVEDCIVSGNLFDSNGVAVAWAQLRVQLEGNSATVADLLFDGRYLYESRSGGFVLKDVAVQPIGIDVMPYYDVTNANVSAGSDCVYSAFTPHDGYVFPESITSTIDERGVSFDVDVEINSDEPLTLLATLNGTNGTHVAQTIVTNLLWSGVQRATVTFAADQLYYSKVDGPYEIGVFQLLKGNEVIWNGGVNCQTASCRYMQFARADRPFTLNNDMPLTMDAKDGEDYLFDVVDVSFDLSCVTTEPLDYRAKMLVLTTNDEFVCVASADVVLNNGSNRVTIPVTGEVLFSSGKDGPYQIREVIMEPMADGGFQDRFMPNEKYLSWHFEYTEVYSPIYLDEIGPYPFALTNDPELVTDKNGSETRILVPLDVRRAGTVTASATVWTKAGEFVGSVSVSKYCADVGSIVFPVLLSSVNGVRLQAGGEYVVRGLTLTSGYERFAPLRCRDFVLSFKQTHSFVNFISGDEVVNEGEVVEVILSGGSLGEATSVDVNLIHNTTVASDLDLTKATVDGVAVKNLKFPYTVKWSKGEVGEKRISIPVKADTTIEGVEMLTLQLGNAKGVKLGDVRVCTVQIRDMNSDITLAQGLGNETLKPSMSGTGKWTAYEAAHYDPSNKYPAFVQSPDLKSGQAAKLDLGTFNGSGCLQFKLEYVGNDYGETASTFVLYDNSERYGPITQTGNGEGWHGWQVTLSSSGVHHIVLEFTQGSVLDVHVRVTGVKWVPDNETMYTLSIMHFGTSLLEEAGFSSGAGTYEYGTKVTLTGKPRPGYEFAYWNGPDNINIYQAKITVVVTNSAFWFAKYKKIPYVRGLADPADGGKVAGSGLCAAGKKVTLKATANKNFTFLGWLQGTGNGEWGTGNGFVATTATLVIDRSAKPAANSKTSTTITNMTDDVTYYAVFKSDPKVAVAVEATDGKGDALTGKGAGKYVAGTITGEGKYAPGKKVTLKATANKGYVFSRWEKTGNGEWGTGNGDVWSSQAASYVIDKMPSNDVVLVAKFITAEEDKESIELEVNGAEMWRVEDAAPYQTNVWCGVYLQWPVAASALSATTVKVAGLPAGLKFADKPVTSKIGTGKAAVTITNVPAYTIYGAPTAASKTTTDKKTGKVTVSPRAVKLTVTTAGKSSNTYQIDTTVDALPAWAVGTFEGGGRVGRATLPGQVSLTVSAAGKVSGKALGDGLTYTLAAPYYSAFAVADDGAGMVSNFLADVTASWSYKEGTKTIKTNDVVQLIVQDNVIGGYAAVDDWFDAYTVNWKVEPWKTLGKTFDKKTRTYAILSDGTFSEDAQVLTSALSADVTGRVTLKFSANGTANVSGEFAQYDEKKAKYTTVKATGSATLVPVDGAHGVIFIYLTPKGLSPHARCLDVPWPDE